MKKWTWDERSIRMKNGHERSENRAMQDKKIQLWFQQNKWKVNIRKQDVEAAWNRLKDLCFRVTVIC